MKQALRLVNTISKRVLQLPRSISAIDSMVHGIPSGVRLSVPRSTHFWREIEQIVDRPINHDIIRSELGEIREAMSRICS